MAEVKQHGHDTVKEASPPHISTGEGGVKASSPLFDPSLCKTSSEFLSFQTSMDPTSHHRPGSHPQKHHQPSSSELLSSAKVVAEAAQASFHHESEKVDKSRVAGAAADILGAASHYGKLEEKSFGKYVEKAETYLHQYQSSHSTTTTINSGHSTTNTTETHSSSHSSGGDSHSGGGYGDYLKMAEGFLKKY